MEFVFSKTQHSQISNEDFNMFHAIDRELYARLVQNLSLDPVESVRVMALWIWLERESNDTYLVNKMLSLPLSLLNDLADETRMCLMCVDSDVLLSGDLGCGEIVLLPKLLNNLVVSRRFFHENRTNVMQGVGKIIDTVCARAFNDILQCALLEIMAKAAADQGGGNSGVAGVQGQFLAGGPEVGAGGSCGVAPPPIMYNPYLNVPAFAHLPPVVAARLMLTPPLLPSSHVASVPPQAVADASPLPIHMQVPAAALPAYDLATQPHILINDLGQESVAPDERTIFLTFSKGYPTSEEEVREFFTRRFGDFIEELIMQEVAEDEQVLYARMVAKSPAVIESIVGRSTAKYTINGKHVWARKYIKRRHSSSPPPGDVLP